MVAVYRSMMMIPVLLLCTAYEVIGESPQPASTVEPVYPQAALADCVSGQVLIDLTITADGRVLQALVVEAAPAGYFEEAALRAVREWLFSPVEFDGSSIELRGGRYLIRFEPDAMC